MSRPDLSIKLEPVEEGKVQYLPLAPATAGAKNAAKLVLRLELRNHEKQIVKVKGITVSFPGSSQPSITMKGVNLDGTLDINPGGTVYWSSGVVDLDPDPDVSNNINNAMFLDRPVPAKGQISVSCKSFSDAVVVGFELAPHKASTPSGYFRFPYAAGELREDEYYTANATHWANGGSMGGQIYAHDIGAIGYDSSAGTWSSLVPKGNKLKNADWRIYGKPVRAVADGVVLETLDTMENNVITQDDDGNLQFPDPTPSPVTGNHVVIKHGSEVVKYCHLQKGSIPAELKVPNAKVWAGQQIGLVGNTGNSTNPHTHLECERDSASGPLRPLVFGACSVVSASALHPPSDAGPWVHVDGQGISRDTVCIWPASTTPGTPLPAVGIARGGDWANRYFIHSELQAFSEAAQKLFDAQELRLIHVCNYMMSGKRFWAGIARSGNWANRFWVSNSVGEFISHAQSLFDEKHLRLVHAWPYADGGAVKWAGIAQGGDWASRVFVKNDLKSFSEEAQNLFDEHDLRLIQVRTFVEGGVRKWLGIARSGNWANRWWISPDWSSFLRKSQTQFDHDGLRLVHVASYVEGNQRRFIGIARSGDWANRLFRRPDLDVFNLNAQQYFEQDGLRLMTMEVLQP